MIGYRHLVERLHSFHYLQKVEDEYITGKNTLVCDLIVIYFLICMLYDPFIKK